MKTLQDKLGKFEMEPTPPANFCDHIGNKTIKIINSEYWGELDAKNQANGYGILISSGEDIYEGYFLNDKRHYSGRHLNKDGRTTKENGRQTEKTAEACSRIPKMVKSMLENGTKEENKAGICLIYFLEIRPWKDDLPEWQHL